MTGPLLLDNSAFARLATAALPDDRLAEVATTMEQGRFVTCLPFLVEVGYSARGLAEYDELMSELSGLPQLRFDALTEMRTLDAQRELAAVGHHRVPPVDLLIAALADRHGVGVFHYDADYDVIRDRTSLDFESVWLAERDSL